MAKISIDIQANSQSVKREMTSLERFMDAAAKRLGVAFQRGGAGKGVDLLTKQMQGLTKATDIQVQKVNTLAAALANVNKQMGGASGADLKALQQQQRLLQRQFTQANTRLGVLQQTGAAAAQQAQGGAPGGQGGGAGHGAALAGVGATVGEVVGEVLPKLLGPLALLGSIAGVAEFGKLAYERAAETEKTLADLMPRLLGPGGARENGEGFERGVQRTGMSLGFTTEEGLRAGGILAGGGFRTLGGLQRDTQTAMQMSRFFGADLGSVASAQAEAGRMGAFRPGDANKFAKMLATEVSKTGLGPRFNEVQEATLMLLNSQLRTQATTTPGPVMALQTMFNRTGLPAFTGTRGAGLINQLQESVTNPRGEAQEALNQQVFLGMGARNFFQMEEMKERGLADPRYLPGLIRTMRRGTGSREEFLIGLQRQTGIPLLQLEALNNRLPGGLEGITTGKMKQVTSMLRERGVDISGGAAKTMDLTGNKLRRGEAALDATIERAGDVIVPHLADIQKWLAQKAEKVLGAIDDNTKTTSQKLTSLTDYFIGPKAAKVVGAVTDPKNLKSAGMALTATGGNVGMAAGMLLAHKLLSGSGPQPGLLGLAHQFGLQVTSGFRPGSRTRSTGRRSLHSLGSADNPGAFDFGGSPQQMGAFFDAVKQNFGNQIEELFYSPKGFVKNGRYFQPGHFNSTVQAEHFSHVHAALRGMGGQGAALTIKVQHDGVVGPHAHAQIKQAIGGAIDDYTLGMARMNPNKRNLQQ